MWALAYYIAYFKDQVHDLDWRWELSVGFFRQMKNNSIVG